MMIVIMMMKPMTKLYKIMEMVMIYFDDDNGDDNY